MKASKNFFNLDRIASPKFRIRLLQKTCQYCGTKKDLTIDHIHPKSRGGRDIFENYQMLCKPCNQKKADTVL